MTPKLPSQKQLAYPASTRQPHRPDVHLPAHQPPGQRRDPAAQATRPSSRVELAPATPSAKPDGSLTSSNASDTPTRSNRSQPHKRQRRRQRRWQPERYFLTREGAPRRTATLTIARSTIAPAAVVANPQPHRPLLARRARHRRSPATIAKHLSALRTLADALDVDGVARVRSARVARGEPRALTADQYARLLRTPDRLTRQGTRDVALLDLLGSAGLRRAEASAVLLGDIDRHPRSPDGRLRTAIPDSTNWWV
jgi:hypothetical protein